MQHMVSHMVPCNMARWGERQIKQREKKSVNGKRSGGESIDANDEIIVQRMSSQVTGNPEKYTRIGAREFLPFDESSGFYPNFRVNLP